MSSQLNPISTALLCSSGDMLKQVYLPQKLAGWVKTLGRRVTPGRMRYLLHNCLQPGFGSAMADVNLSHPPWSSQRTALVVKYMNGRQRNAMFLLFCMVQDQMQPALGAPITGGSCALSPVSSCWQSQHPQPHSWSSYHTISALRIV